MIVRLRAIKNAAKEMIFPILLVAFINKITMFSQIMLLHGLALAIIDATVLPLLKLRFSHKVTGLWPLVVAFLAYGSQTLIFYNSLRYETMTVMNVLWDVMSDVIVTFIGLFILKEVVTTKKLIGIAFGFVSLYLLSS